MAAVTSSVCPARDTSTRDITVGVITVDTMRDIMEAVTTVVTMAVITVVITEEILREVYVGILQ